MTSAVEQLLNTLKSRLDTINRETTELREQMIQNLLVDTEKYNEIFKEQIIKAHNQRNDINVTGESYYNKTYESKGSETKTN